MNTVRSFMDKHYKHFNAASLVAASQAYEEHINSGDLMMVTLAGAMSTAELGKSLAEMIRQDKVHLISCTGANLEEDVMNLVAHKHYKQVPHYRDLSPQAEADLLKQGYNRVTDTCIPEEEAFRVLEAYLFDAWTDAQSKSESYFPHEYLYAILKSHTLKKHYQIDAKDSWLLAAAEKNIPMVVPGWEDSTTGNIFASYCLQNKLKSKTVKSGIDAMMYLCNWYKEQSKNKKIGMFQVGGGIAGDFPICVVPMINQDMPDEPVPLWAYFCQISDSTTSYGSYSGAVPNEKITWGKLDVDTPKFMIESDASIVAPLVFAYLLNW